MTEGAPLPSAGLALPNHLFLFHDITSRSCKTNIFVLLALERGLKIESKLKIEIGNQIFQNWTLTTIKSEMSNCNTGKKFIFLQINSKFIAPINGNRKENLKQTVLRI